MVKIILYGNGYIAKSIYKIVNIHYKEIGIIGYTNTSGISDIDFEVEFIKKEEINRYCFDYIVVAINSPYVYLNIKNSMGELALKNQLVYWEDFLNDIRREKIIKKYRFTENSEIREIVHWLETNELTVRNLYENKEKKYYQVFWDETNGYPYVIYNGYKMYYPKQTEFVVLDGKQYIINVVENDQYSGSPHLYLTDSHMLKNDSVIIDAGVAEGNFTLANIDKIKRAYLFECDPKWLEVLKLTFAPFKDKVCIIEKKLGDFDNEEFVTLDGCINEAVDFVKMDIEGAEVSAILGGIELLKRGNVKLSVCTYHRKNDAKYLEFILGALGYRVSYSNGFMFFAYDDNIDYSLDFRRGVMYASKLGDKK